MKKNSRTNPVIIMYGYFLLTQQVIMYILKYLFVLFVVNYFVTAGQAIIMYGYFLLTQQVIVYIYLI